ncbi:CopG family transcriptional regulator [Nostoc sp. TCL26-01]|uniref:CopG family transcriptional regulator n=1 Tax=Nostoc sp. TCL26-01 TaxID=2576904 RepID=UPI0015B82F7E|nr:CopG family transcriptional regulator [Nostoc sp. TCL26-01]
MNQDFPIRQIKLELEPNEAKILEDYCNQTGLTQIDVIKQLIHQLPYDPNYSSGDLGVDQFYGVQLSSLLSS